ncbi:class I SAM-dependent methyltransferase [Candidatus Pacearchaeota archaeon]|nr:class I SAM-dependent methyltransferase [Candidatus Pacearchaeota archaeon]
MQTLKNFPVFFGCTDEPAEDDIFADMKWAIDPETGVIQLTELIPLEILYKEQHVDGCGATWMKQYESFASYIAEKNPNSVLEIGGGQGTLAELVTQKLPNAEWAIIEPNPTHKGSDQIKIIKGFFDENFKYDKEINIVVFSHVWEHAYDPRLFIEHIASFLKPGGKLIFAYPDLKLWLEKKYTNAINFEHTMLLTDHHVEYLLRQYGFRLVDKRPYEDNSFFYTAEKVDEKLDDAPIENKYEEYKKIFMDYVEYHEKMIAEINDKVEKADTPVYLFGAHIFSQHLISCGLKIDKVVSILDNSPTKQGKRLYGTNLITESPKILADKSIVNVILKAGVHNEEIKKDILENINDQVVFW